MRAFLYHRGWRAALLLSCLLLLLASATACHTTEQPSDPTEPPAQGTVSEDFSAESVGTLSEALPHLVVSEQLLISEAGLRVIDAPDWTFEKSGDTPVFIMRSNMEVGVAQLDVTDDFADAYAGGSCFLTVAAIAPVRGVTMTVEYQTVQGEQKSVQLDVPYQPELQKLQVRLDAPATDTAADLTVRFTAIDEGLYVRVASISLHAIDAELPPLGSTLLIEPRYDNSAYGSGAYIAAVASVAQFGAVGDGKSDDTSAFEAALKYAASLGGGTVYVPEGRYALTRTLTMPAGVALVGELDLQTLNATGEVKGSVLLCYPDAKGATDAPMFTMNNYSTLQSLAFWYPEQTLADGCAQPYPPTVAGKTDSTLYGTNLENLVFVNSYDAIRFDSTNVLQMVRNVYGTPLHTGIFIGNNYDIARFEGVCFSTYYWSNSALPLAPAESDVLAVTRESAVGAIVERVDWTYMFDLAFDGYRTGILFRHTTVGEGDGSANGSLYGLDITNCRCGIEVQQSHEIGLLLTDSHITAGGYTDAVAILLNSDKATAMTVSDCVLESEGKHVIYNAGNTALSVSGSTISKLTDDAGGAAVHCAAGSVSLTACEFTGATQHLYLGKTTAQAIALNCGKLTVKDESHRGVYVEAEDPTLVLIDTPDVDIHGNTASYRPDSTALVDLGAAPYAIKDGEDITERLQAAIDSLAGTGGTVYLPVGTYRVEGAVTVRSGVELRGALDASISRITNATRLVTDFGKNDPEGTALLTLESGAGLVGIRIGYDKQDATALVPYSYAVRGAGAEIYLRHVSFDNVWNGLDLASAACDRHMVKGLMGVSFHNCIRVGGGSEGGIIRDVLNNPAYWDINNTLDDAAKGLTFLSLEDCKDQLLYANFHYAGQIGLLLGDGCENAVVIAHGSDYGNRVIYAPEGNATATLVNTQMATFADGTRHFIETGADFGGSLRMIGISGWSAPHRAVLCGGGDLSIRGGNLLAWGMPTIEMTDGRVSLCGVSFTGLRTSPIVRVEDGELALNANLTPDVFVAEAQGGSIGGCDAIEKK